MIKFVDVVGQYLASRKGLLPLLGCLLVLGNFAVRLLAPASWLAGSDVLLHLGILTAILGLMLARVL